MPRIDSRVFTAVVAFSAACGRPDAGPPLRDSASTEAPGARAGSKITVPQGFKATLFADSAGLTRHIVVSARGDLYANTWRSPYDSSRTAPAGGFGVAFRDTNSDGRADVIQRFGPTSESGSHGGTGIAVFDDAIYIEADSSILRYRLAGGELAPTSKPDTIVAGLTTEGGHPMHPIAIDPRGNLFVDMGSATNACQEKDRQKESRGVRPCPELKERAGIWRFSATRVGQRFTRAARYATGIRNADGLAINPGDGALYATQHGRDQLGENWPGLFDWKRSAELPSEELLRIDRGADYGWPYCYYDPTLEKLVSGPEYGGDGKKVGECASKKGPAAVFPAHWAPNALVFYAGTSFPEHYRGGAFIAFHGSWNRAPEPQQGYNVVFQPMANGKSAGPYQVFADGFAGARKEPGLADHRPAGLAVSPEGSLYISDDQKGWIWKVTY